MSMSDPFKASVLAEMVSINQALGLILAGQARASGEPDNFCQKFLEVGLRGIESMNLWGGTDEELQAVKEDAANRFSDLVTSAAKNAK